MRLLSLVLLAALVTACDTLGTGAPEIVRYTGPEITEADADAPAWGGLTVGNDVLLAQQVSCGEACTRTLFLDFQGRTALPSGIEGYVVVSESSPQQTTETPVPIARVEIQDWGPRVFSGVAYPVPQDDASTAPIVFWTDDLLAAAY